MATLLSLLCFALPLYSGLAAAQVIVDDTSALIQFSNLNDWTTHGGVAANWSLNDNTDTFSSKQGAWLQLSFNGMSILKIFGR
jgi:hypothetical protein